MEPPDAEPPFQPVAQPRLRGREREYVEQAIAGGWLSSQGPFVQRFEEQFAASLGATHAVAVTNGTAALHLAMEALRIGAGDEVIVPAFTMSAPVFAVLYAGARPVPVDADDTWNLDPAEVERAVTPRTRALLAVHTYGHPARMDALRELADRRGIALIEDAAEAHGATVCGRVAGAWGDVSCFSFYANKLITTGEGGMLVTGRDDLAARARWKRGMCFGPDEESRFTHQEVGFNYRMTSLQAAVGLAQLEAIDEALAAQRAVAAAYRRGLDGVPGLTFPPESPWADNVYWVFGVLVDERLGMTRAELQARLRREGIETRRFFTPVHRQPFMAERLDGRSFPRADDLYERGLYLPSGAGMSLEAVERVCRTLRGMV